MHFRLRNPNNLALDVRYEVEGTGESNGLVLPARPVDAVSSDVRFWVRNEGTVRVYFDGELIQTAANAGTACQQ